MTVIQPSLKDKDLEDLYDFADQEHKRQNDSIELTASENVVSRDVMWACSTVFMIKYAEGYPGNRWYSGQKYVDMVETAAIEAAKALFNCAYANVQPHSGCPANVATYQALVPSGGTILAMNLGHGGHLSHGSPVSSTSKSYNFIHYSLNEDTLCIERGELQALADKHQPALIMMGFSSYPRNLDYQMFREVADSVGALLVMDSAHIAGLIAGGQLESPFDYGVDVLTSTTHKTLRGPRGGLILTNSEKIAKAIDFAIFPGNQGGPHVNTILAKAVAFREALRPEFSEYTGQVLANSQAMAAAFIESGVSLITGGTDNHLLLIDSVQNFGVSGAVIQNTLESVGIMLNKNVIPFDTAPPATPSGIRLGSPAMTTRGFRSQEFVYTVKLILKAINVGDDPVKLTAIRAEVKKLVADFPLPI